MGSTEFSKNYKSYITLGYIIWGLVHSFLIFRMKSIKLLTKYITITILILLYLTISFLNYFEQ